MGVYEWQIIVTSIIAITGLVKTIILISNNCSRRRYRTASHNSGNNVIELVGNAVKSSTETGPMVYYATDHHGNRDKEYRFNYKKVNGSWRAYILRMPSLRNRSTDGHSTHRFWDGSTPYVCWDRPVNSLNDMQTISRVWADNIQEYIATGKTF